MRFRPDIAIRRFRERKLGQWALAYVAASWALLEVLDLLVEHFAWSSTVVRISLAILGVGLFVVLVLAWYHGEKGRQTVSTPELLMITGLLVLAGFSATVIGPSAATQDSTAAAAGAAPQLDYRRIAVLPLRNTNPLDPDGDVLAAGVHEDLLTRLSRISGLRVVSRTSVMEYAGTTKPIHTISRELGAGAILEGSVQRSGETVRVTVQLIDAQSDQRVWTETYEQRWSLTNLFAIQADIAERVAAAMEATIGPSERVQIGEAPTHDEQAFALFVEAATLQHRRGEPEILGRQIALLTEAVERDPRFVRAWTQLAQIHAYVWFDRQDRSPERMRAARSSIETAIAIDSVNPDTRTALGYYQYWVAGDLELAAREFEQILVMSPLHPAALIGLGAIRRRQGRLDEALQRFREAFVLDPRASGTATSIAETLDMMRRYDEAEAFWRQLFVIDPLAIRPRSYYAEHLLNNGDLLAAREQLSIVDRQSPGFSPAAAVRVRLELYERNPRAVLQLVHSLTDNGHPSTQLAFWPSELLAGEAYHLLGIEDSARLHFSAAERILRARLNQDADDDRAWGALGLALSRLGAGQEAVRAARHAVALVPSIRDSWRHSYRLDELARTQLRSGDTAGAMETVERLMAGSAGTVVSRATLRLDPEWDALRDLPRFRRLTGT